MSIDRSKEGPVRSDRFTQPVGGGEVPLVDGAVAVGENLEFQEKWWKFERAVWILFGLILVADIAGAFGGGPLSQATIDEPGLGMHVKYQRIARTGTPAMMAIQFGPDAVQDGTVKLFVSDAVVKGLGAQRVIPQPQSSALTGDGMTYTFPAGRTPGEVDFELSPGAPGVQTFRLQIPGRPAVSRRVVVMP